MSQRRTPHSTPLERMAATGSCVRKKHWKAIRRARGLVELTVWVTPDMALAIKAMVAEAETQFQRAQGRESASE